MLSLLQSGDNSQRLRVALEPAQISHLDVKGFFALMTEWRMSKVVAPAGELDQIDVETAGSLASQHLVVQTNSDRLCDLADLQGVRQSIPKVVRFNPRK